MQIRISWSHGSVSAELRDTPTTRLWAAVLPFESRANIWGDEVYFDAPFEVEPEPDARQVVDVGAV